ncbi:hypothetical protein FIBSPDRAFT_924547 [Athelia psychrophila]|uniref:DUF6534 domain-containing protein n=1 Tax=Athelia psychrophila TaxID=1759441 RepID=A0A166WB72_9AGAM|nr:hypothetical protein FIBSPDRAFT_924547 [Fibularhizoctonia sp. CBS 109695]
MSTTTTPASLQELESTLGVLFIGFLISTVIYGFTFFQTYLYFSRFPNDPFWTKLTAGSLCVYYYLIDQFLSPIGLLDATSTFCAENGLAILITFIVQVFYASRIFQVGGRSWLMLSLICTISLLAFGFGITMTVQIFKQKRLAALATPHMEAVAAVSQGLAALADIIIVVALNYALLPSRNPKMKAPEGYFDNFVVYFINRGVCFTIFQLTYMIVFVSMPSKQIWIPFHLVVSKLYVNTLLATLNSREMAHGRGVNEEDTMNQTSTRRSGGLSMSSGATRSGPVRFNVMDSKMQSIGIDVTTDSSENLGDDSGKEVYGEAESVNNELPRKETLAPEAV